jgi:hypothetical protein
MRGQDSTKHHAHGLDGRLGRDYQSIGCRFESYPRSAPCDSPYNAYPSPYHDPAGLAAGTHNARIADNDVTHQSANLRTSGQLRATSASQEPEFQDHPQPYSPKAVDEIDKDDIKGFLAYFLETIIGYCALAIRKPETVFQVGGSRGGRSQKIRWCRSKRPCLLSSRLDQPRGFRLPGHPSLAQALTTDLGWPLKF